MSWQEYVDDHLMCEIDGNHLAAAAIISHDGTVWAQSAAFPQLKLGEILDIMKAFDEVGSLASTRIHLGGSKYKVIKGEAGTVFRGKEVFSLLEKGFRLVFPCFSTEGPSGVIVKKTGLAIIIGIYDGGMAPGQCNMIVEKLGEYLVDKGF